MLEDSEAKAVSMGGHLVTVSDQEEHRWIMSAFPGTGATNEAYWIGLIDPDPAMDMSDWDAFMNHFVWASGLPITFFAWAPDPVSSGSGRIKMILECHGDWARESPLIPLKAIVEVPLPAEIVTPPAPTSVGIGRDVTLKVVADGTAPVSYQWQFMGTDLPGETRSSLTITTAQPSQSGLYRVVVSNQHASVTSSAALLSVQGIVGWGFSAGGVFDAPAGVTNVISISSGSTHTLALKADGTVIAWGMDSGKGETRVPPDLTNAVAVAAGNGFSAALRADGSVSAWGSNWEGETSVPEGLTNVVQISPAISDGCSQA